MDSEVAFIGANPTARAVQTLHLGTGETAWVGIYGTGAELPKLIDNGRQPLQTARTRVAGRCYWQCQGKTDYLWWFKDENTGNPHWQECKACEAGSIDACNSCKANDPIVVSKPHCYCWSWAQTRQLVDVDLGWRTYPVTMQIDAAANKFQLRWPEASEVREVSWPLPVVGYLD